jgi:hypothetical protein
MRKTRQQRDHCRKAEKCTLSGHYRNLPLPFPFSPVRNADAANPNLNCHDCHADEHDRPEPARRVLKS